MGLISVSYPSDGTTADVSDYNTPLTTIVTEFNGNIDNNNIKSSAAIDGSKIAANSLDDTRWKNTVAFRAYRNASLAIVANTFTDIVFDMAAYNYGNTYSTTSGLFTAPTNGIYSFIIGAYTESNSTIRAFYSSRGTGVNTNIGGRFGDFETSRMLRVQNVTEGYLAAGQTFGVTFFSSSALSNIANADTYFCGHLITRL